MDNDGECDEIDTDDDGDGVDDNSMIAQMYQRVFKKRVL